MEFLQFRPEVDFKLLLAVPLIPLVGYVINVFFGRRLPRRGDWLLTSGMFAVMLLTVFLAAKAIHAAYAGEEFLHESVDHGFGVGWLYGTLDAANDVSAGILYDSLGATMLAVVGVVSFFIHLYSIGYMHGDRRYHIFFANISLFTFSMLGFVLADNILFLFMFWELMGFMSYQLIGHFSHDPSNPRILFATAACKKAFLTTRVGDVCLFLGIAMFYAHFETFRFTELWARAAADVAANGGEYPAWMTTAGLFVFGGTVGKSAQFPLHIWLPDAMEGPTPVSAMIHAATMVAAGVFLLGRTYPLLSPEVLAVVATVGTFTAIFAATIGMTVNDIKGVLAYSTISQLGFMVAAVGCFGVAAGMFHMVTHAFFKACLFLCAGSVIHGCHHEQDMRRMGGLRKVMPLTFLSMLISTLAISGVPFFSGFFSKDQIIAAAFERNMGGLSGAALFAAVALPAAAALTAFYMFRLIFMTFFGEYRGHAPAQHGHGHGDGHGHGHGHAHTPHESPATMTIALLALATLAIFGGEFWLAPLFGNDGGWFAKLATVERLYGAGVVAAIPHLAHEVPAAMAHGAHSLAVGVSVGVASLGIIAAWLCYQRRAVDVAALVARFGLLHTAVANKYYIDEVVNATVVRATMMLTHLQKTFDERVIDGAVNLVGRTNRLLGSFSAAFDRVVVDGAVNMLALVLQGFGAVVRLFQTGRIQQYAAFAVAGSLLVAAWLVLA